MELGHEPQDRRMIAGKKGEKEKRGRKRRREGGGKERRKDGRKKGRGGKRGGQDRAEQGKVGIFRALWRKFSQPRVCAHDSSCCMCRAGYLVLICSSPSPLQTRLRTVRHTRGRRQGCRQGVLPRNHPLESLQGRVAAGGGWRCSSWPSPSTTSQVSPEVSGFLLRCPCSYGKLKSR